MTIINIIKAVIIIGGIIAMTLAFFIQLKPKSSPKQREIATRIVQVVAVAYIFAAVLHFTPDSVWRSWLGD